MKVRAIVDYFDLDLRRVVRTGEEIDITEARAKKLSTVNNAAGIPLVEVLEVTPTPEKVAKEPKAKKVKKDE